MTMKLEPPDLHHLNAAEGWLGLGDHLEAGEELRKISLAHHSHPGVLEVRWHIHAKAREWSACVVIAEELVTAAPDCPHGWLSRSAALYYSRRTREAHDLLLPALEKFPTTWMIRYDMACYCAQLARLPEAREWLKQAIGLGGATSVRQRALEDPDLERLWPEIREMEEPAIKLEGDPVQS
jgi:hypothetical protein